MGTVSSRFLALHAWQHAFCLVCSLLRPSNTRSGRRESQSRGQVETAPCLARDPVAGSPGSSMKATGRRRRWQYPLNRGAAGEILPAAWWSSVSHPPSVSTPFPRPDESSCCGVCRSEEGVRAVSAHAFPMKQFRSIRSRSLNWSVLNPHQRQGSPRNGRIRINKGTAHSMPAPSTPTGVIQPNGKAAHGLASWSRGR